MKRLLERVASYDFAWLTLLIAWACVAALMPLPNPYAAISVFSEWASSLSEGTPLGFRGLIAVPVLGVFCLIVNHRTNRRIFWPSLLIACYVVLAISETKTLDGLIWPAIMILPLLVASLQLKDAKQIGLVLFGMLVLQAAVAALLYLLAFDQFHSPGFGNRASGFFYTPNGLYPLTAAGFLLSMGQVARLRRFDVLCGACCLLCGAVTVWTYTRGALLGVGGGILAFAFFRPLRVRWLVAAVALTTIMLSFSIRNANGRYEAEKSATGRVSIWHDSIALWLHHPWLGDGHGAFVRAVPNLPSKAISSVFPNEPKSLYLNLLLEGGIAGFIFFWGISGSIFWKAIKIARDKTSEAWMRSWAEGTACYLVFIAVAGITDTPIFGDDVRLSATFAWALMCGVTLSIASRIV